MLARGNTPPPEPEGEKEILLEILRLQRSIRGLLFWAYVVAPILAVVLVAIANNG